MPPMEPPRPLTALAPEELAEFFKARELPAYRARQIWKWVWQKGATDYAAMSDLPKELRERLARELPVVSLTEKAVRRSAQDGTVKALLAAAGGRHVEAVGMPGEETGKLSVCVSTQVGCGMGCAFCASSVGGLKGNLRHWEILDQVLIISRLAGSRATSVVLMGMGEPLANYDNSLAAVKRLVSPDYLGLGARHVTVSTVGLAPQMLKMPKEWPPVNLAVSLHAPTDELRRQIVPIAKKWSIAEILEAAGAWAARTGRRYTVEYALIEGTNAARKHAEELAALLRRRPAKVNLIALNPGGAGKFAAPGEAKVRAFRDVLAGHGLEAIIRRRRGRDIEAACGQLRLREEGETQRTQRNAEDAENKGHSPPMNTDGRRYSKSNNNGGIEPPRRQGRQGRSN